MNQLLTVEVAAFVDAVDAALADLPADVRAELLEDLPAHLADVVAEGGTPRDQLGEPADYAADLRAAAGYPLVTKRSRRSDLSARLRGADARIGNLIGYARLSDLLRALQPAWWVLRGYLATLVVSGGLGESGMAAITPQVGGSEVLGFVALIALVGLSVWAGRRSRGRGRITLVVCVAVAVALGLFGVQLVSHATQTQYVYSGDDSSNDTSGPLDGVGNIYPYGPDGKLLQNTRLYDESGNPIDLFTTCSDGTSPPEVPLYPLCPQDAAQAPDTVTPGRPIDPLPGASSTPTATPAPTTPSPTTPAATPAATPGSTPAPTASK